jgi:hypothetical protein
MWPDAVDLLSGGAPSMAGTALGILYVNYGLFFLLLGTMFLFHGLVLLYLVLATWRPRLRVAAVVVTAEVLYGLVNPLVYLVIIESVPAFPRQWGLSLAGWLLLAAIWASRIALGADAVRRSPAGRRYVRGLALAAMVTPLAFLARDLAAAVAPILGDPARHWPDVPPLADAAIMGLWMTGVLVSASALYVIPSVLALGHVRATESDATWDDGRRFFLVRSRLRWLPAAVVPATLLVAAYHPPASQVERRVVDHRAAIREAAGRHGVDPALIASIIYVTQRDLTTPLADGLERAAMAAWLADPKDNFFLVPALNVSVGIAQIKPLTAMTALILQAGLEPRSSKEYRGVPALGWTLPAGMVAAPDPAAPRPPPKRAVVEALLDDRRNIEMCALILAVYAAQWEAANPAWSIRQRPEILATLYQIGFERSRPKADPRPNRFGERVAEVRRGAFVQSAFGPTGGPA